MYRSLEGKPERKRSLGRSRCRRVDNIKMDRVEIKWGCEDWIDVSQDGNKWRAVVNMVMNVRVL
jgi:hypothetical protein